MLISDGTLNFQPVSIPHDWLIYNAADLYENSIGLYKKTMTLTAPEVSGGKRHYLYFEGVYMDSTVFVNGEAAYVWKYGYTSFEADITEYLRQGENTIHVAVVHRSPNSRWYSGAGIYRRVWLKKVSATHLVTDGLYVSNRLQPGSDNSWECFHQIEIASFESTGPVTVETSLSAPDGTVTATERQTITPAVLEASSKEKPDPYRFLRAEKPVPVQEAPGYAAIPPDTTGAAAGTTVCRGTFSLKDVHLWNTEDPYLYTLTVRLFNEAGDLLDETSCRTGFRTLSFDKDRGFFLNGRHIKIHGACLHHDLGSLGAAFNKSALKRQFQKMFQMGVNSIRTSHNPPAPEFLELADETGMLIDCEAYDQWERPKTAYDYGNWFKEWHGLDTASWIRRDRNHPSIIMWSIGNEIYDTHLGTGLPIAKDLAALVHTWDFRQNAGLTIGSNYIEWDNAQMCMGEVDYSGYNYAERLYEKHHEKYPEWRIYGSETSSTVQSRGIYHFPADFRTLTHDDLQCSSLGNCSSNWGSINTAMAIVPDRNAEFCLGQYIWTGWDYIGEPTPYFTKNSYFGQIDTAGFRKDTFFQYQAEWTDFNKNPMIHLLPWWDFNNGQIIDIKAYTNAPEAELFFNGKSLGRQKIDHKNGTKLEAHWKLPYSKGTIKAVALDEDGHIAAEDSYSSFGDPANIRIMEEQQDDLIFADICTVDNAGVPVENARNRIHVTVEGGVLLGLDNGDSTDYEQYKGTCRKLFNNHLMAIVQRSSLETPVRIIAASKGLEPVCLTVPALLDGNCKGKPELSSAQVPAVLTENDDIPVRKIELTVEEATDLTPENPVLHVKARILPENATFRTLEWKPCRLEGVQTSAAKISVSQDTLSAVLTAAGEGSYRLRCTASNGADHPEVVSEIEFSMKGFGSCTMNPYNLISACEYSAALHEPKLSFQGGVYVLAERNWLLFENLDFGTDGSDQLTIPIFSFDEKLPLELWEGNPDEGGRKLASFEYASPSWYNHYQSNTWKLPCRLTGIHSLSILSETRFSIQGIQFTESRKAFSQLSALDSDRITGDTFTRQKDRITGIGNNVSLEFHHMDYGEAGASRISIEGRSVNGTNTVHIKFTSADNPEEMYTCMVEVPKTEDIALHSFTLEKRITGRQHVTFVFLPGSNFDFKSFEFGE